MHMVVASFSLRSFRKTADIKSTTTNYGEGIYPTFFRAFCVPMVFIGMAGFATINGLDESSPYRYQCFTSHRLTDSSAHGIANSTTVFVDRFCCLSCCCVPYFARNERFTGNNSFVISPFTVLPICLHAPE